MTSLEIFPRLTGTLRMYGELCRPVSAKSLNDRHQQLEKYRKEKLKEAKLTWEDLNESLKSNPLLRELQRIVREVIDDDSFQSVNELTVEVFDLLMQCDNVEQSQVDKLRQLLGEINENKIRNINKVVKQLVSAIPPEDFQRLFCRSGSVQDTHFFGSTITFCEVVEYPDLCFNFYDEDELNFAGGFDMRYTSTEPVPVSAKKLISDKKNFGWIKERIKQHCHYLDQNGVDNISQSTFGQLCSDKTNEELQNELFDLLGFERFELIQELLSNRSAIVKSPSTTQFQNVCSAADQSVVSRGVGIRVQSDQEKSIRKFIRKEEKKNLKREVDERNAENDFDFDPQLLRAIRESELELAMNAPLFSKKNGESLSTKVTYPNVYDRYTEAKNTAAFIAGVKMTLPAGFERKTQSTYEEINIPCPETDRDVCKMKRVSIDSLDEIGQIAFKGVKELNQIQSMVFNTAYHTNENLLICAPTGAGKTNIAMLCIIREIKRNLEQGKIQLDKFKIVYVAPMKALAAEMVENFSRRLAPLGVKVRELTGDMQLTKSEIKSTQILVTTPEKWDVVTRKSTGDVELSLLVRLLIIDEVHLLHDDRGAVLEALVSRTLRQVEMSQTMIRIIGLSATLPNYIDVARFLNVNPFIGLFFFDGRFRPVPLGMSFIGVKGVGSMQQMQEMDKICYDRVLKMVEKGHQVIVFVHARMATVKTASTLRDMANENGRMQAFSVEQLDGYKTAARTMSKSRNKQLLDLFPYGFSFHNAGMLRSDRNMVEKLFLDGLVKVLVSTATLAWGVNLPAHAVIIKGTELYDSKLGTFIQLGILDVIQIFGRAGRPQFEKSGHGTIITTHDQLSHYLSLLTRQYPIESQFKSSIEDNLNAEISLGTVTTVDEAVHWLSYTYLFMRMRQNPWAYGIKLDALQHDPDLFEERQKIITKASTELDKVKMIRYEPRTGYLHATDIGRTSSHFYIKYATVDVFNSKLHTCMTEAEIFAMVAEAQEFEQMKVRDEELDELDELIHDYCMVPVAGGSENIHGKVNILIQTYLSQGKPRAFSLVSDMGYVVQNIVRIMRALFEITLKKNWSIMARKFLVLSKSLEKQLWSYEHPLKQFKTLSYEILSKIEAQKLTLVKLKELEPTEIGHLVRHVRAGSVVKSYVSQFPWLELQASVQPITRSVLRVSLTITPCFHWNDKVHGKFAEPFWIWIEDPDSNYIYHTEYFSLTKKQVISGEDQQMVFIIPISEPLPSQYLVQAESDRWLGASYTCPVSFHSLVLPDKYLPHTDLLDLEPLPVTALGDPILQSLYKFTHFNPIQTQVFHTLFHTDHNVLLGAPTGSGKTIVAEIAMFRVFREYPGKKIVYIAPLKALVRERVDDWKIRLEQRLHRRVVELTGDTSPDIRAIEAADVIVTTPEKWDGISRSWQTRSYVRSVSLIIIDEIHLLGEERGPVLEVIVSRNNFIADHTGFKARVIGLSTALANAKDLADWLNIKNAGLYNFRPSVRPVPMEIHIQGFSGKHYCPRMATMNKPTFQAIVSHSPEKPALVFVSSRRQTRLTALDLIAFLAADSNPKRWLHIDEEHMADIISKIKDANLKLTLAFGVGLHHAGLQNQDRKIVEHLFVGGNIQVLIATSTLAWGVNFPAHLVVIKGTEYYDGKTHRYVDFPITDVLQMVGRAGRPQFDDHGTAVVLVHDVKKHFYRKFLYEPFPVESNLVPVLAEHINAEIVAGTITSVQSAMDYLTWTYYFRRLLQNPSYYHLEEIKAEDVNRHLSKLVCKVLTDLQQAHCIDIGDDGNSLCSTTLGCIASYYYLSHKTVKTFVEKLTPVMDLNELLNILCHAEEYAQLPVRHNEDIINGELATKCPLPVDAGTYDSPHTKTHLLLQAHFSRQELPMSDYLTDLKSVCEQVIRIIQAIIDICGDRGWLSTTLLSIQLLQMCAQGRWCDDSSLLILPHVETYHLKGFLPVTCLPQLMSLSYQRHNMWKFQLKDSLDEEEMDDILKVVNKLPIINVELELEENDENEGQRKTVKIDFTSAQKQSMEWITVNANKEYSLKVCLNRLNRVQRSECQAHCPRFPRVKDEGWILILGNRENGEMLALKRIAFVYGSNHTYHLSFCAPPKVGRVIYTLYLMSDSYLGLDQQMNICMDIVEP
ncbi:activating signal cointegrator 1 complex subunit [Chamberlinius hualienensis]